MKGNAKGHTTKHKQVSMDKKCHKYRITQEEEFQNSDNYKTARLQLKLHNQLSQTPHDYCKTRKETNYYAKGPHKKHTHNGSSKTQSINNRITAHERTVAKAIQDIQIFYKPNLRWCCCSNANIYKRAWRILNL